MKLDQWDAEIAPRLQDIQLCASWIGFYSRKVEQVVKDLTFKAPFDTLAEQEMEKAINCLIHAAATLAESKKTYQAKTETK